MNRVQKMIFDGIKVRVITWTNSVIKIKFKWQNSAFDSNGFQNDDDYKIDWKNVVMND